MTEFLLLSAAASEADAGWGRVLALILTAVAFWGATTVHRRWRNEKNRDETPVDRYPALPAAPTPSGVNPQVSAPDDPNDPGSDPLPVPAGGVARNWGRVDVSHPSNRVAVPPSTAPAVATARPADLDEFVAARLGTQRPVDVIREGRTRFGRSEATVKRAIRRVRLGARREAA